MTLHLMLHVIASEIPTLYVVLDKQGGCPLVVCIGTVG